MTEKTTRTLEEVKQDFKERDMRFLEKVLAGTEVCLPTMSDDEEIVTFVMEKGLDLILRELINHMKQTAMGREYKLVIAGTYLHIAVCHSTPFPEGSDQKRYVVVHIR